MTNKELQTLLKTFPEEAVVFKNNDCIYDEYFANDLAVNYRNLKTDNRDWEGEDELSHGYDEINQSKVKTIIL